MSLISVEQAAAILGVSRATAYRMATERRIPTVRWMKRGVRVHAEQLQQMIDDAAADSIRGAGGASEETLCPTKEQTHHFGGSLSPKQAEKEYADLRALAISQRRKR